MATLNLAKDNRGYFWFIEVKGADVRLYNPPPLGFAKSKWGELISPSFSTTAEAVDWIEPRLGAKLPRVVNVLFSPRRAARTFTLDSRAVNADMRKAIMEGQWEIF